MVFMISKGYLAFFLDMMGLADREVVHHTRNYKQGASF